MRVDRWGGGPIGTAQADMDRRPIGAKEADSEDSEDSRPIGPMR